MLLPRGEKRERKTDRKGVEGERSEGRELSRVTLFSPRSLHPHTNTTLALAYAHTNIHTYRHNIVLHTKT